MRIGHFETLRPICPVCRRPDQAHALRVADVVRSEAQLLVEGMLHCTNSACQREYPVIDGIPFLIGAIRSFVSDNLPVLLARDDLSESIESLLSDCAGPGSWWDSTRQHLSSYTWDHYGDLDPLATADEAALAGSLVRLLDDVAPELEEVPPGPILDAGCGVGRAALDLARRFGRMVLGIDVHCAMLRVAQRVLREGRVRYARRRTGVVYDRREFDVPLEGREQVDYWACDAHELPLAESTFAAAVAFNTLDSVRSPIDFLQTLCRSLQPGGRLVLACPYDWSSSVTPFEAWLGGHSQRSPMRGNPEPLLEMLLTPGAHLQSVPSMRLVAQRDGFSWPVRIHDRSMMTYRLHVAIAEKVAGGEGTGN